MASCPVVVDFGKVWVEGFCVVVADVNYFLYLSWRKYGVVDVEICLRKVEFRGLSSCRCLNLGCAW